MAADAAPSPSRDPRRGRDGSGQLLRPDHHGAGISGRSPRSPAAGPAAGSSGSVRTGPTSSATRGAPRGGEGALDPAGRHANGAGDGFGRLVGLTVLGAAVPGAGLVAAGRRRTGWAIIAVLLVVVGAVVALVVTGRAEDLVVRLGSRPDVLLGVAVGAAALALAWCAVILTSHLALRRHRGTGTQRAVAVVLVAALMGLVAVPAATASRYALSARSTLTTVFDDGDDAPDRGGLASPDAAADDPWAREPRVNVLLLGSDAGADRTGVRPDTVIVASIDTRTGDTVLISLPRNLQQVPFPAGSEGAKEHPDGWGTSDDDQKLLNAVWRDWGEAHPEYYPDSDEPGRAATRSVVSEIIGMPVDYDVIVNLEGFEEIVDAMGGLRVDVPERLPIGGGKILTASGADTGRVYPVTDYVEAGQDRLLDGYEALWFARSRWQSNDYERMNRQRCVLQAAVDQYGPLKVAQAFPAVAATADRNLETDIPTAEIPAFVELGKRVKDGEMRSLAFTSDVIDTTDPDYPKMRRLIQRALLDGEEPARPAPTATPSPTRPTTPTPSASGPSSSAPGDDDGGVDVLAAPQGDPIVDPATVCG